MPHERSPAESAETESARTVPPVRRSMSPAELAGAVLQGDRLAIARAISQVERGGEAARNLLRLLYPHTGRAHIVGITGAPGSGKSTLVTALVKALRATGDAVGVVAVDPTSPFTGGALLGDRVRMRDLSGDDQVFVRSMATRGNLGGLSQATNDAVAVLDVAGFAYILVETVGVGQAEIEIAATAHTTLVVEAPGMGDEIQAIKAGILEIADLLVVNKADRPEADRTVKALEMMLDLGKSKPHSAHDHAGHHHAHMVESGATGAEPAQPVEGSAEEPDAGWTVPVLKTIAATGQGVDELHAQIEAHRRYLLTSGEWQAREMARATRMLETVLHAEFRRLLQARLAPEELEAQIARMGRRELDPYTAAQALLSDLLTSAPESA